MPLLCLATLFAPAIQTTPHTPGDDPPDVETRRYDVRALLGAQPKSLDWIDMRLPGRGSHVDAVYLDEEDTVVAFDPPIEATDYLDTLDGYLSSTSPTSEHELRIDGGWLEVTAPEVAQNIVGSLVNEWLDATRPTVTVDALWIPRAAFGPVTSSLLSPAEAAALFAEASPSARGFMRTPYGRPVRLGRPSREVILSDYDVAVTEWQFIADPTVTWMQEGAALGIRVDRPALGSNPVVRAWGREVRPLGEPRRVELTDLGDAQIDLPHLASSIWTTSARLAPGGALVIDTSDADGHVVVIRVSASPRSAQPDSPLLELGELVAPTVRLPPYWLPLPSPSRGLDRPDNDELAETAPWMVDRLDPVFEAIRRLDLVDDVATWRLGTRVLVDASPSQRVRLHDELARIAAETFGSTLIVELAAGDVRVEDVARLASDTETLQEFVERAAIRMSGSVLEGDTLMLLSGDERAYVSDFDMHIAMGASGGDPIISHLFQGTRFWLSPVRADAAGVQAWVDMEHRSGAELPRQREVNVLNGVRDPNDFDPAPDRRRVTGPLELVQTDARGGRALVDLEAGAWQLVFVDPDVRPGDALAVALRVRVEAP